MTRAVTLIMVATVLAGLAPPARASDGDVSAVVELAAFAAGGPLDAETRRRLSDLAAGGAPEAEHARLAEALAAIRALKDEARRADLRRRIVTTLYWSSRTKPDRIAELILSRSRVVAADPESRVVVRRADLAGLCRSAALAREAVGEAFDRADCAAKLEASINDLGSLEPAGREIIASGERRAAILDDYWRELAPQPRIEALKSARARAGSDEPLRVARSLETAAIAARLDARFASHADAVAESLAKGAAASTIRGAARGF